MLQLHEKIILVVFEAIVSSSFFLQRNYYLVSQDYKSTLHLPATDFPMRGNLPKREPQVLEEWDKADLYAQLRAHAKGRPQFVLHDGPPYANGAMHLGHAVNKVLKDIIVRSKHLDGFDAPFVPGWDCHGLPIEIAVEKTVGKAGLRHDVRAFREQCRNYALAQLDMQRRGFKRLGVIADWDNPYKTLDFRYEANTLRALAGIIDNGHLSCGAKPVHWCLECASALAEAEIEYALKRSVAIDVAYAVRDSALVAKRFDITLPEDVVLAVPIWTTTAWTLPASLAVAVASDLDYVLVEGPMWNEKRRWLLTTAFLAQALTHRYGVETVQIHGESVSGRDLEGITLAHPFYADRQVPVIVGAHVSGEEGTGAVHTAPGHGQEDFVACQPYHILEQYTAAQMNPVDGRGYYVSSTPPINDLPLAGTHIWKAIETIIAQLRVSGHLLASQEITHSYPHCWRHKTPIVFRATPQWFISMEQANLRPRALKAIETIEWIPEWGQSRIHGMVANRPDWTISRQRVWGVPITLFVHRETRQPHPSSAEIMRAIAERVEKEGIDIWDTIQPSDFLGNASEDYEKINDILDVWFDSGVTHYCVLPERNLHQPADLYLEGSDQHRGWFQSALLTRIALNGDAPYKQCLTHGFTVDARGRKMSKSLGNGIEPEQVLKNYGADILRLWIASTDYTCEMSLSEEILKRTSDAYRRIRNTARFILGNLNGFDPAAHLISPDEMVALDRWIVNRALQLQQRITNAYQRYNFAAIVQDILNFCSVDLGALYLDVTKDRLYTMPENASARRSAQTALYHVIQALVGWITPITPFTAEECWSFLPGSRAKYALFSTWYTDLVAYDQNALIDLETMDTLITLREHVAKKLEGLRAQQVIGAALEAEITLHVDPHLAEKLSLCVDEMRFLFISGDVHLAVSSSAHCEVDVQPTKKPKCIRCWHHRADVGQNTEHPELCGRCVANIAGPGEARHWF